MKQGTQITLIILGFIAMALLYWSINMQDNQNLKKNSVTKSNFSEKNKLISNSNSMEEKITKQDDKAQKSKVLHYKDIFKEPKEVQTEAEKIIQNEEIRDLDSESKALINEADELIEKENLKVEMPEISEEEKQKYERSIDELDKKLEKLETK